MRLQASSQRLTNGSYVVVPKNRRQFAPRSLTHPRTLYGCPTQSPTAAREPPELVRSSLTEVQGTCRTTTKEREPGLKHVIPNLEDVDQALVSATNLL